MDSKNAAKETMPSLLSSLISLTFASASSSSSSAQQPYFSELLSFKLDCLQKELDLLRVNAERIRRQMQEVAVGNRLDPRLPRSERKTKDGFADGDELRVLAPRRIFNDLV